VVTIFAVLEIMNQTFVENGQACAMETNPNYPGVVGFSPQVAILDTLIPGFSLFSTALNKYTGVDLNVYIPAFLVLGLLIFAYQYVSEWASNFLNQHLMSTADIRIDDEMYNMVMAWIAKQNFAKRSRHFVANTNLNSRMWWLFGDEDDNETDDDDSDDRLRSRLRGKKDKKVQFTPSFGTHYFWFKGYPMIFSRTEDTRQQSWGSVSERENISISSFGRNPELIKELLDECRAAFSKNDENKTIIYRGGLKPGSSEPTWTRSVSRVSRPFSTVVLDADVKQKVLDDMTDYLNPQTRRWYSNRGVPYRRGYLLFGPPGTGKSSLSFAIAGYFKLKIYIVSLNSMAMNEENLGTLFSELPQRCVVLLEDIDTAGLTHTREAPSPEKDIKPLIPIVPGTTVVTPRPAESSGRISLSALLNIIDGVAATEGRILIMTTNPLDKLDDALIRPGRVDMTVKFDLANTEMIATIFRGIFVTLEGDVLKPKTPALIQTRQPKLSAREAEKAEEARIIEEAAAAAKLEKERVIEEEKVSRLAEEFAAIIPSLTFSPAELQGHLLKWKRDPEGAVRSAAEWVSTAITEKKKLEREEREREEKENIERAKAEKEKLEREKNERENAEKEKTEAKKTETEKTEKKEKADGEDSGVEI
jgi:chaperone BCS1